MVSVQYITAGQKFALEASYDVLKDVRDNDRKKCGDIDAVAMVGGELPFFAKKVPLLQKLTFNHFKLLLTII